MALDIKFLAKTKTKDSGLCWVLNPSNLPQQFSLFNHGPRSKGAKWAIAIPIFLLIIIFLVATAEVNDILKHFLDPISLQPPWSLASVNIYWFC